MQARPSTNLLLFLLALKRTLTNKRISLDQFLGEFKFLHPRGIARFEFARIVQRINAEGSNFDALALFAEMTQNSDVLSRENLKKWFLRMPSITVHKLSGSGQTEKTKPIESAPAPVDKRKQFIKTAMPALTKYISSKDGKPSKIFDDCDLNRSGEIDRLEFNKFLFASGLPEFKSRDHCRYMIDHIFDNYAGERMSKQEFFTIFKLKPTAARKNVKREPIQPARKIEANNSQATTIVVNFNKEYAVVEQKVFASNKPKTIEIKTVKESNPERIVHGKPNPKKEAPPPPPAQEEEKMEPMEPGEYPNLEGLVHVGEINEAIAPYAAELDKLLASNKQYLDPKNPANKKGVYKSATEFLGEVPELFQTSAEDMNRDRQSMTLDKFIDPTDINQGEAGDCYFLTGIVSLVGKYPELVSDLFIFEANDANYYVVQLFLHGEWVMIKTDDRFPVDQDKPVYTRPKANELWAMLLEKVFAKVYGSYSAIESGNTTEAYLVLTGAPYVFYELQGKDVEVAKKALRDYDQQGYLLSTSANKALNQAGLQAAQSLGLVTQHAYSILGIYDIGGDTLVKMRNPWGNFEWSGEWNHNDPRWTPQLRQQYDPEGNSNDGIFFISWMKFWALFGQVEVCKVNPTFVSSTLKMTLNRRKSNYYRLTVSKAGKYHIFSCQQTSRKYAGKNYQFSMARIIVMKENQEEPNEFVGSYITYQAHQICSVEVDLEEGNYIVAAKVFWGNGWTDHDCFLNVYGVEVVEFEEVDRQYASQFKEEMVDSYCQLKDGTGQTLRNYANQGLPEATLQVNLSNDGSGLAFVKITNNSETKSMEVSMNFTYSGMKIIKPKTNPYTFHVGPNEYDVVGFFLTATTSNFSWSETIKIK